jgi:hypothetical protein
MFYQSIWGLRVRKLPLGYIERYRIKCLIIAVYCFANLIDFKNSIHTYILML